MALLILFGFIAGGATALSPCVLPILPVALSAGATGGNRRPLGIVTGLALSFTFATVALVYLIDALGLPGDLLRNIAIATLLLFGVALLVPAVSDRLEAAVSGFTGRFAPSSAGDGFFSGGLVGLSLGLVYAPCAGPILAGVITVSASQPFTAGRLAVALAYGLGSAVVLYALLLGGRRLMSRISRHVPRIQLAMGAVMVVFAVGMFAEYDLRFQQAIANDLPAVLVNPSGALEDGEGVADALAEVRDIEHSAEAERIADRLAEARPLVEQADREGGSGAAELELPVIAPAPEFTDTQMWFNTPGGEPLTMDSLRGRVVVIDFWTYSCINCIRTQPYLKAWHDRYSERGLTIVGVHTPEFPFERSAANVKEAIERAGIEYPVVQDNEYGTWNAYANRYWPAKYFIDAEGRIRYAHFGEGEYEESEEVIRTLLAEAGHRPGASRTDPTGESISSGVTTPESYLGSARAAGFVDGPLRVGTMEFGEAGDPPPDYLDYGGRWEIKPDYAVAASSSEIALDFGARRVFLVLGSPGKARQVRVELDGRPISPGDAGSDVSGSKVTVTDQRLYDLVDLPSVGRHTLRLRLEPGVEAYAFTFG